MAAEVLRRNICAKFSHACAGMIHITLVFKIDYIPKPKTVMPNCRKTDNKK